MAALPENGHSAAHRLIEEARDGIRNLEHMVTDFREEVRLRLADVERTARENAQKHEKNESGSGATARERWKAIGHIAVALAAFGSLALQLFLR